MGAGRGTGRRKRGLLYRLVRFGLIVCLIYATACLAMLIVFRVVNPPVTTVQLQRHVEARLDDRPYQRRYRFVPLDQISPHLRRAVIAARHWYQTTAARLTRDQSARLAAMLPNPPPLAAARNGQVLRHHPGADGEARLVE